jgi:anti-sigma regulatory factor (Ser/Thr protein kinase)
VSTVRQDEAGEFGVPPGSLDVVVPARAERLPELRDAARRFALANGVRNPESVALAITEACTNAVLHAAESEVPLALRLTGAREGDWVMFVVNDRAHGPMPGPASHGLGRLPLIASVADHVAVADTHHGSRIQMSFAVRAGNGEGDQRP